MVLDPIVGMALLRACRIYLHAGSAGRPSRLVPAPNYSTLTLKPSARAVSKIRHRFRC